MVFGNRNIFCAENTVGCRFIDKIFHGLGAGAYIRYLSFIEYVGQPGIIIDVQPDDIFLVGNIIKGAPDDIIGVVINGLEKIIHGIHKCDFRRLSV